MEVQHDRIPLVLNAFVCGVCFVVEQHSRYIKPNTARNYIGALKVLRPFFGEVLLRDITITDIRRYQAERGKKAGPYLLNSEISVLQMILKEARCWKQIADLYKPMRVPKRRAGHSISADEERVLREVAFSRPKWRLAAHCMMVMLSTTMGFGELRHVRRRDVDLKRKSILVRDGAKNDYRDRTIPLNAAALDSMMWLLERWEKLGGSKDDEFILPHRPRSKKGPWILTEPMSAITSAFNGIRKAAGLPKFRVYDCRVQAITKLLSNPDVSPQVSKEIAGHISQTMQNHYSIQQFDTKMAALEALEHPAVRPDTEPTPPAQQPASASLIQPALQAEIDRLRTEIARLDLALQERRRPRRKSAAGARKEETFYREQPATNVIAFPNRSA